MFRIDVRVAADSTKTAALAVLTLVSSCLGWIGTEKESLTHELLVLPHKVCY